MSGAKEQIAEIVVNNPKAQTAVGAGLIGLAADAHIIQALNIYVTFFGGLAGATLTCIMIYKNIQQIRSGK